MVPADGMDGFCPEEHTSKHDEMMLSESSRRKSLLNFVVVTSYLKMTWVISEMQSRAA